MRNLLIIMTLHILLEVADTQQVCPPTEIVFLLDQSETALLASTDNISDSVTHFNLVKVALDKFLLNQLIINNPNQVRVGVYGYSSSRPGQTIIPEGTSPLQALTLTHLVSVGTSAGSWTYRGLQAIQRSPVYPNNHIIIVSAMGSNSSSRRSLAEKEVQRVGQLGWRSLVIAVQGRNPLDLDELTMVNGGITPVVLDDGTGRGYTRLASHLDGLITSSICVATTPMDTVTSANRSTTVERLDTFRVCQSTETLLLLDESEAARLASSDEPGNKTTQFNILKSAVDSLLANEIIAHSRNTFRIGAYGYSDAGRQNIIIPEGTSPVMARTYTSFIGRNVSLNSESLTYSGLEMVRNPPFYQNNRLIIVSTRGSWSTTQRSLAQREIARIQKLGWSPLVIAVQGSYPIDTEELMTVNGGNKFVTLDDFRKLDPKSYRLLPATFDNIVNNLLCPVTRGKETHSWTSTETTETTSVQNVDHTSTVMTLVTQDTPNPSTTAVTNDTTNPSITPVTNDTTNPSITPVTNDTTNPSTNTVTSTTPNQDTLHVTNSTPNLDTILVRSPTPNPETIPVKSQFLNPKDIVVSIVDMFTANETLN